MTGAVPVFFVGDDTATAFAKTFGRLLEDRGRLALGIAALGLLLLGAWFAWIVSYPLRLYEVSSTARLELDGTTYPVQAGIAGKVCLPDADPEQGREYGSGLSPDLDIRCDPDLLLCVLDEEPPSTR